MLRDNGYYTYMAGKWHLGHEAGQIPHARSFERSLTLLNDGASHWPDMTGLMEAGDRYVEGVGVITPK